MKKKEKVEKDEMRAEYDFSGAVRGKHANLLKKGHKTIVRKIDGSVVVTETLPIILDPEVKKYFPNSKAVNKALRGLIELVPDK
jgi:predicted ATP-grasp superfamily ATP-dependent carboligase